MWFCFNDGFCSAVQDRNNPNGLVVRARRRKDIRNIFPDKEIIVGGSTDYNYRVFCTKEEFAKLVANSIMNIKYDNFKNSVRDYELHELYADFWHLHFKYQYTEKAKSFTS
jgi:biotin synthase-like enzyme